MPSSDEDRMPFHVLHKIPAGDGPYVRAKRVQLIDRNPDLAVALFRSAIDAGDHVDSALKDMAIVLKQQNRGDEAILAIGSYRSRCSPQSQESLDNVLLDLYKSCGRLDDQIALLLQKLRLFQNGQIFNGKRTKTARSQGKKFQVSIEQEASRLLGNLGWAYMQQSNYTSAEAVYRKALAIEVDNNKLCNLGVCLMKQGKFEEAISVLRRASASISWRGTAESHVKSYKRAQELAVEAYSMLKENRYSDNNTTIKYRTPNNIVRNNDTSTLQEFQGMEDNHEWATRRNLMDAAAGISNTSQQKPPDEYGKDADALFKCPDGQYGLEHDLISLSLSLPSMYMKSQEYRRLPVFQDLTVSGSAAAA